MAGLYIHVPFCKQKCTYCDFASFPKEIGKTESYFACLYREMEGRAKQYENTHIETIYIGGGTPSVVPAKYIAGAIRQAKKCFNVSSDAEITIELNPGTVDSEKIKEYKSVGINRFSVGLQTGFDDQLKRLNRVHTAKDFLLCMNMLKGENVSADLLIGLHDQTAEQVYKSIDLALAGGVKHISVYALTPEVGTPIYTDYLNGELLSDDETAEIYEKITEYLKSKGFNRYEVSNFAVDGFRSRHNMNYWERGEYIGVGVSASSFMKNRRFTNSFKIDEYMNAIIYNKSPEISSDVIEKEDAMFEKIMLALRTSDGLNIKEFNAEFDCDFFVKYKRALDKKGKYLDMNGDIITIKPKYLYVQNDVLLEFMN